MPPALPTYILSGHREVGDHTGLKCPGTSTPVSTPEECEEAVALVVDEAGTWSWDPAWSAQSQTIVDPSTGIISGLGLSWRSAAQRRECVSCPGTPGSYDACGYQGLKMPLHRQGDFPPGTSGIAYSGV